MAKRSAPPPAPAASLERWRPVAGDPEAWQALDPGEQQRLGEALRDRFFAHRGAGPGDDLARSLSAAARPEPVAQVDGLDVSFFPGGRFCWVRFVEARRLAPALHPLFARPDAPSLLAVFVDPREFSFRTFENLIPLDRLLDTPGARLSLSDRRRLAPALDAWALSIDADPALRGSLLGLDALGLYVPPLDPSARGGQRFLFHAAALADALTRAVREAMADALGGPGVFSHVNPVFRCNRFEPGDGRFHRHLDNPYFDRDRRHVSRFTVLLYLTGGEGDPALLLGGHALRSIAPMTCVIFDQRIEHEGAPYLDGRKVFLRTELIFELDEVAERPAAGQAFARACYFTGESLLDPALTGLTSEHYRRAAAAHWGDAGDDDSQTLMLRDYNGLRFAADGHDFWFLKRGLSPAQCAAIVLLDFFNARVDGAPFRSLCRSQAVEARDAGQVEALLRQGEGQPASVFAPLDVDRLMRPPPSVDPDICCSYHHDNFHQYSEVVERYSRARGLVEQRLAGAPIVLMGQQILLDPARFLVEGGRIHVLSQALEPVHFAACQNATVPADTLIGVKTTLGVLQPLVLPILFAEVGGCYRLTFDFFRNSWALDLGLQLVPVPEVIEGLRDPHLWGAHPWQTAVALLDDEPRRVPGSAWWQRGPVWVEREGQQRDAADPAADADWLEALLLDGDARARVAAAANPNLPMDALERLLLPAGRAHDEFDRDEAHVAAWLNPLAPVLLMQHPDERHEWSAGLVLLWLEHLHGVRRPDPEQPLRSRLDDWLCDLAAPPGLGEGHAVVRSFALHLRQLFGFEDPASEERFELDG